MKYLYWRGAALWCRYPVAGKPDCYPLKIFTTGSKTDKSRCERIGEQTLAELRTGVFFDNQERKSEIPYKPTYRRLAYRYIHGQYWFTKWKYNDKSKLRASIQEFGHMRYDEIESRHIIEWMKKLRAQGYKENTIRNYFFQMSGVYRFANEKEKINGGRYKRITYNPCIEAQEYLENGDEREFLLTPAQFEKHYSFLLTLDSDFHFFYLVLWECGRRPLETAQWRIEYLKWDAREIVIPPSLIKGRNSKQITLPLSDRAWHAITALCKPGETGWIFKSKSGQPWLYRAETHKKGVTSASKTWMNKLKAKFGAEAVGWMRDNRGGFVSLMCENNDPLLVGSLAGQSPRTVARYNKRTRERQRHALSSRPAHDLPVLNSTDTRLVPFRKKAG